MNQNGTGQAGSQDWRQVYYDNHWWYYTPNNNWLYYNNNRWNPYTTGASASNGAATSTNPTGANATGRYGVGYRGDSSVNSGATGQDLVPSSSATGGSTRRQNSTTNNGAAANSRLQQRAAGQRPLAPSESDLRMYEQKYFNSPNRANPGPNSMNVGPEAGRSSAAPSGPGTGVDVTGIPPSTP